tara:strand:+ start:1598 stop:1765 length:168 start_codon:yes stop_codon:yes gene_type:complete
MNGQEQRPWLEIPVPAYAPLRDLEDPRSPKTKKGDIYPDESPGDQEEKRVIIIDL